MKGFLFMAMALPTLMTATTAAAESTPRGATAAPDTTVTYRGRKIVVTDDGNKLSVSVSDQRGKSLSQIYVSTSDSARSEETWNVDDEFEFKDLLPWGQSRSKKEFKAHSHFFNAGFNTTFDGGMENALTRSSEIGFNIMSREHQHTPSRGIWYGLGFNWRTMRLDDGSWYNWDAKMKKVRVAEAVDTMDVTVSRLRTFRFMIPVAYEWQDLGGKPFFIQIGLSLELVPTARLYTSYKVDGHSKRIKDNDLRHNILGGSAFAKFGYHRLALYASFVPTPLFSSSHGPEFKTLTFGLCYCLGRH